MLEILIFVAVAALGLVVLARIGRKPVRHKGVYPDRIGRFLEVLLRRGYNGGVAVFEVNERRRQRRFIQFVKYIRRPGEIGIAFAFPNAPWSREYVEPVRAMLAASGVAATASATGRDDTTEFVNADLGSDIDGGVRLADKVFQAVFHLPSDTRVDALLINVNPRDELVSE